MARLEPVAGSGVRGTATVQARAGGPAVLTLEADGLRASASYTAHLRSGTCAAPSASSGLLGQLQANAQGRGSLQSSAVRATAAGVPVDLTLELVGDGDHLAELRDGGNVVACGQFPRASQLPVQLPRTGGPGVGLAGTGGLLVLLGLGLRRWRSRLR
jgi:hypothetical protein